MSKNVSEIKSFLGLLNCCHRHFQGFTDSVEAHHNLLKKEEKWGWQEQKKCIWEGKKSLDGTKFLIHCYSKKRLLLASDASFYNLGAVLSHLMADKRENFIIFAFKVLSKTEHNYLKQKRKLSLQVTQLRNFTNVC